jgi:hypothetical protein
VNKWRNTGGFGPLAPSLSLRASGDLRALVGPAEEVLRELLGEGLLANEDA